MRLVQLTTRDQSGPGSVWVNPQYVVSVIPNQKTLMLNQSSLPSYQERTDVRTVDGAVLSVDDDLLGVLTKLGVFDEEGCLR